MKRFALRLSWLLLAWASLFVGPVSAAELDCLVKPEMYVEVSSPVISVLEEILVEVGDVVSRGQPLAKLEASIEKARVEMAELQAKQVSDIENRKIQLQFKKLNHERMQQLREQNSVPQFEADKARTEYALAQTELAKAREIHIMARANLEIERSQLALRTIVSPIDGIVVDRYAMVGESVEGRSIMKLAQVNPLKVELIAPTEYFGLIHRGMVVEIYPEQPANKMFKATVTIVDKLIDPASGSFTVRMLLPNPDDRLVAGVNCLARFKLDAPAQQQDMYGALPPADTGE
ncbi:MAG: efflux RND transporter periplasmic adaptor subunit [Gammaproteobacteria bacterium]|nr:efflux RND transporter periplasmic adaptor subunit [Gammaproteobacteria bacterium]